MVYLSKDRKLKHLTGRPVKDFDPKVEHWNGDMISYLKTRSSPAREQVDFILSHLEGQAREEIRYREGKDIEDPQVMLYILLESFGNTHQASTLQSNFCDRRQKSDETLRGFSHS